MSSRVVLDKRSAERAESVVADEMRDLQERVVSSYWESVERANPHQAAKAFAEAFPGHDDLVTRVEAGDLDAVREAGRIAVDAYREAAYGEDGDRAMMLRPVWRALWKLSDALGPPPADPDSESFAREIDRVLREYRMAWEGLRKALVQAIARVPEWHGSNVTLEPWADVDARSLRGISDGVTVRVGRRDATFTMWPSVEGGKVIGLDQVEDVLEDLGAEFFSSPEELDDYFHLIAEVRNPGSLSKEQRKWITLYTARPRKDRRMYQRAKVLPNGVFLADSFSHVDALAQDLGGARDVWKVTVERKALHKTLDGSVRYYQVVAPRGAKIKRMVLV